MASEMDRRDFLASTPAAMFLASNMINQQTRRRLPRASRRSSRSTTRASGFGRAGGRSSRTPHATSISACPDDDILHGNRAGRGLPAPGSVLGGWCGRNSNSVLGQWLSGMSRLYRATGDARMRDKAVTLMTEWAKTVKPDGDAGMRHYPYDKLVCGLVDLQLYAGHEPAMPLLEKVTDFASKTLDRSNNLADPSHDTAYYGVPQEWYTLSENLFRAYRLTGNPKFKTFGEVWLYHAWWNKFARTSAPPDAHGVHAYSHVNTFSSAAMAYDVLGDASYLQILRNGYDYLQQTQVYATGGYGPNERFMAPDGSLGRALDTRSDTAEIVCGSWAGFKMARYLMRFTGEARYGDWMERLFYNGVGAALPAHRARAQLLLRRLPRRRRDEGLQLGQLHLLLRHLQPEHGRLLQPGLLQGCREPLRESLRALGRDVATARRQRDRRAGDALSGGRDERDHSEAGAALTIRVEASRAGVDARHVGEGQRRGGKRRVPAGNVGDARSHVERLAIKRRRDDSADARMEAVDRQHPDRVAVMRGPVVLILEGTYHAGAFRLPERDDDLATWLVPEPWSRPLAILSPGDETRDTKSVFRVVPPDKSAVRLKFRPFYDLAEGYPYFMYFDRKGLPYKLW